MAPLVRWGVAALRTGVAALRPAIPFAVAAIAGAVAARASVGLRDPEEEEAGQRRHAEHGGGLTAREVRRFLIEILDRAVAQPVGEAVDPGGGQPRHAGELRGVRLQGVGGGANG